MSTKALREKRAKLAFDAQEIIKKGDKITPEDTAKFDEMMAEVDRLGEIIERAEKAERVAAGLKEPIGRLDILDRANADDDADAKKRAGERDAKFYNWLRNGTPGQSGPEQREFLHMPKAAVTDPQSTTAGVGGELIPIGFSNALESARLQFGGMLRAGCTTTPATKARCWPRTRRTR
jgi:HK97 family phage major capsid protein